MIPLPVWLELNMPQPPPALFVHVAVQSSPSLTSFGTLLVIVAETCAVVPVASAGGGAGALNVTAGWPMVTLAEADFVMSFAEVAERVTEPPAGAVVGAV
jgi:hypothetical protein